MISKMCLPKPTQHPWIVKVLLQNLLWLFIAYWIKFSLMLSNAQWYDVVIKSSSSGVRYAPMYLLCDQGT